MIKNDVISKSKIINKILELLRYKPVFKNKILSISIIFITGNRFTVIYKLSYGQMGVVFNYDQIEISKLFKLLKEYAKI